MATKPERVKKITRQDAPTAGVAVTITPDKNTHVGVLYRDDKDDVYLLHLKFHCDLVNQSVDPLDKSADLMDPSEFLCADPCLEMEDAEAVAGHCRAIARDNPPIWFAIHYNPDARLAEQQGKVKLVGDNKGLNCSTFVLAVFKHAGPGLVAIGGWPQRASDKTWHRQLVRILRLKAPRWHADRVEKDVGCARVRPEEVAGACLEEDLPATHRQCIPNGVVVRQHATRHTGRASRWSN
jgi:hypothetical protein